MKPPSGAAGTGFVGPRARLEPQGYLLFSDMPGDVIRRWDETDGIQDWRRPSSMANGLTYDAERRLVTCEHATSRVTRTGRDGTLTTIASHYDGKELNSPNDIVVKSDGSIYFTDPGVRTDGVLRSRAGAGARRSGCVSNCPRRWGSHVGAR